MKIRLAILESDEIYLKRIVSVFGTKYPDQLEIYSFTDQKTALDQLASLRVDVLIAGDSFEIDTARLPKRCGFAYFVDTPDIELLHDQSTICRFQKAELIYRQILSIHAEHVGSFTELRLGDEGCQMIFFSSPSGGSGCSTMSAACAMHFAAQGKKTFYLNLEPFGSADDFFSGPGQFNLSDIIYALKNRKANLTMKLESCVRQDASGVCFLSAANNALDMMELSTDEKLRLIQELANSGIYQYLIVDTEFGLDQETLRLLHHSNALVMVGSGTTTSNTHMFRALKALSLKEQEAEDPLMGRLSIAYNRFSNKTGTALAGLEVRVLGGAPRYEHATTQQLLQQLSQNELFDKILK